MGTLTFLIGMVISCFQAGAQNPNEQPFSGVIGKTFSDSKQSWPKGVNLPPIRPSNGGRKMPAVKGARIIL